MTSKEVSKWADKFQFTAEKHDQTKAVEAFLLGAPVDPLGQMAACAKMYKGEVVRDIRDVTDEERRQFFKDIMDTVLVMPTEAVHLHFMIDGVHRGITHQMVRQRSAGFAQESMRFAVVEDLPNATALPVSLRGTLSEQELYNQINEERAAQGLSYWDDSVGKLIVEEWDRLSPEQRQRLQWDKAVKHVGDAYSEMVNSGMAAEDARGLLPTNVRTRLNYITNLRGFYDTMSKRVGDQAQFEWREIVAAMVQAMYKYGEEHTYEVWEDGELWHTGQVEPGEEVFYYEADDRVLVRRSSLWQYKLIAAEIKPIEFKLNGPAFGASFDRPSRIGERIAAFHQMGVPSSRWLEGAPEHNIPAINPAEYLLDPGAARLKEGEEFDIFGNKVPAGRGLHWRDGLLWWPEGAHQGAGLTLAEIYRQSGNTSGF